jgi:hypothetical protein
MRTRLTLDADVAERVRQEVRRQLVDELEGPRTVRRLRA